MDSIAIFAGFAVGAIVGMTGLGGGSAMLAGALFYMVSSTLAISALFLMIELLERDNKYA